MFNSVISIAITLVFMYLLLAIMVTAINELVFTLLRSRATQLEDFLTKLFFNDEQWNKIFEKVKSSPFINVLKKETGKFPASIPAENFAKAVLAHLGKNNLTIGAIEEAVNENKDTGSEFFQLMKALLSQNPTIEELRKELENIYNSAMERLTGWYRRKAKLMSFGFGLSICLLLNVDTLTITQNLWKNKDKAEQIASFAVTAGKYIEKNDSSQIVFKSGIDTLVSVSTLNKSLTGSVPGKLIAKVDTTGNKVDEKQLVTSYNILASLDIPVGWSKENIPASTGKCWKNILLWFIKMLGIFLSTVAVSLGAPYWFDILNKLTPLKQTAGKTGGDGTDIPRTKTRK